MPFGVMFILGLAAKRAGAQVGRFYAAPGKILIRLRLRLFPTVKRTNFFFYKIKQKVNYGLSF
jgi:hypothetical protein